MNASKIILVAILFLSGCGNPAEQSVKKLFRPSHDKDVTTSPRFNFSSFVGTVWKTKVKTAVAEVKRYTGAPEMNLLAPLRFDPADPRYTPIRDMKIVVELPAGTRIRIARLLQDQGAWGGIQVEAILQYGTNVETAVYVDPLFWSDRSASNTNWGVNPNLLEKAN